jgi:hypothetical protein
MPPNPAVSLVAPALWLDNNRASRFSLWEGRCPGDLFQEKRALQDREKALYCDYRVG